MPGSHRESRVLGGAIGHNGGGASIPWTDRSVAVRVSCPSSSISEDRGNSNAPPRREDVALFGGLRAIDDRQP
jgi:hypothetical protein